VCLLEVQLSLRGRYPLDFHFEQTLAGPTLLASDEQSNCSPVALQNDKLLEAAGPASTDWLGVAV
jgi:hypothetical protein